MLEETFAEYTQSIGDAAPHRIALCQPLD
jgi:hypothetical protein